MANLYGAPEIDVHELDQKIKGDEIFTLLDVREPHELLKARLPGTLVTPLPLSRLARELTDSLPAEMQGKESDIVIMCHTGVRSAQVTAWLIQQGWNNVRSLQGGIDAYAKRIDPQVGLY